MTEDVERDHLGEIYMDTKKPFGCLARHGSRDGGAPVATLRDVPGISEPFHKLGPRMGDTVWAPARAAGLPENP